MLDFFKKFNCFEFDLISPKRDSYHIFISRKLPAKDLELTEHRGFGEKTFKAIAGWHDQNESQRRPKLMERRKALKSLGVEARVHYDSNAGAQGAGEGRGAPRGLRPGPSASQTPTGRAFRRVPLSSDSRRLLSNSRAALNAGSFLLPPDERQETVAPTNWFSAETLSRF